MAILLGILIVYFGGVLITKYIIDEDWYISFCIHNASIYDENFFIENYPIKEYKEEGKIKKSQEFTFNKLLIEKIRNLLLPNRTSKWGIKVNQSTAWNYYHYTLYIGGFTFNVHPVSMGNDFIRQSFKGTQEEIYNKCVELSEKWISKDKNL